MTDIDTYSHVYLNVCVWAGGSLGSRWSSGDKRSDVIGQLDLIGIVIGWLDYDFNVDTWHV